jgi:hypothetical protein
MTGKRTPQHPPIYLSTKNISTSLLGTLSENEIQMLLNLRTIPSGLRASLETTIATTAQHYVVKPRLFLVGATIEGSYHHG